MPSLATPSMVVRPIDGIGHIDDFRIDAGAHRFEHGLAGALGGEIDRAGAIEIERDAGLVRGDQREDDLADVAAGEIMRLERIARDIDAGFHRGDAVIDDQADRHFAQAHSEHFADADRRIGNARPHTFLAALGIINPNGVNGSGQFQPDRDVQRAEVSALIARIFGWQNEPHSNPFPDKCDPQGQGCIDDELWNDVAALADYGVVGGYTDPATCASAGTTAPCYLPRDSVKRVQVISIIARAFTKTPTLRTTGFWDRLPANLSQYTNVPDSGTQRSDLTTYRTNAGPVPGQASDTTFPDPEGAGSRRFIVAALFQAFNAWYGSDRVP